MDYFKYEALNDQSEVVRGEISAESASAAILQLEHQGLIIQTIRVLSKEDAEYTSGMHAFKKNLGHTLSARKQWLPMLDALAQELPDNFSRREATALIDKLRRDLTPEDLLASPDLADLLPLLTGGLDTQSSSRRLNDWLTHIVSQKQRKLQTRRILVYPFVLCMVALLVVMLSAFFIVPVFRSMFSDFGLMLPWPTLRLFQLSEQLTDHLLRTLLVVTGASAALFGLIQFWRSKAMTNRLFGRLVSGTSSNLHAMSQLTSVLAELVSLEAPLHEALRLAGSVSRHAVFAGAARKLASELQDPNSMADPIYAPRLPHTLVYALRAGAEQRPNVPLLRELATLYAERIQYRSDWVTATLPAVFMIAIGIGVGFLVIALFLPLFSLVQSLA